MRSHLLLAFHLLGISPKVLRGLPNPECEQTDREKLEFWSSDEVGRSQERDPPLHNGVLQST